MSRFWEHWWGNRTPPNREGLPQTFPAFPPDERATRRQIFDPALKQFPGAYRAGAPEFRDADLRLRWCEARRRAMDHVLRLVAGSGWRNNLVLRGSVLLRAWHGSAAREPGDLDWVVIPQALRTTDTWSHQMLGGLESLIARAQPPLGMLFDCEAAIDDIWTYERAPGKRMIFLWQAQDMPPGQVQMDFVFGERLPIPAAETDIPLASGESVKVLAATPELSLAWKLVWLETDMYPQGKDLYDATLLALETPLRLEILRDALRGADWRATVPLTAEFPLRWQVDWQNFRAEHPWIEGEAKDWQVRLSRALAPTFSPATGS